MRSPIFDDALIMFIEGASQYSLRFPGMPIETKKLLPNYVDINHDDLSEIFTLLKEKECIEIAPSESAKTIPEHFILLESSVKLVQEASKKSLFRK